MFIAMLGAATLAGETLSGVEYERILSADAMTAQNLGVKCLGFAGELTGTLAPAEYGDAGACHVWKTEGTREKGSWSSLGMQFANPRRTAPIGFRLAAALSRPVDVVIEARVNGQPEKGFWITKWLGRKTFPLEAGRQYLEKTWAELDVPADQWGAINAISLAITEPLDIHLLGFELVYPAENAAGADAALTVNWFDANQDADRDVNPVARPFDKLTHLNCLPAGGARESTLRLAPHLETGADTVYWGVEGNPAEKGWALYQFGLRNHLVNPAPAGLRFEVYLTEQTNLTIQPLANFDVRHMGFYSTKKTGGAKTVALAPGRRTVEFLWRDFGVDPSVPTYAVNFSGLPIGGKMFFERIDLVFADAATANQYRSATGRRLAELHRTMADSLAARGVDWKAALAPLTPERVEPLVWVGTQLSAQREQIAYFTALSASAGAEAPELAGLEARRAALVKQGAAGTFDGLKRDVEALQAGLDSVIDRLLAEIPKEKRRFAYKAEDRQFHYPDGRPFRMFGPHFFRSIYWQEHKLWRPWDLRYLSGFGFNGIRLFVGWSTMEPARGTLDPTYLGIITGILREAERYGFGVSIDLHWPYPDWYRKGAPGFEASKSANPHNSYHWPEALVESWERLGQVFADHPNIVAFEVPTNETPIASTPNSFRDTPYLQKRWNDFLRDEYKTRDALDAAWRAAGDRYGLAPDENWDDAAIAPQGFQGDADAQAAYRNNPRVYDHLRFAARLQAEVSGDIVKALRRSIPGALGMFQTTIGGGYDKTPVPLHYGALLTCVGEHVIVGTHYGMGGLHARKAATLSRGSYDSEQQMVGLRRATERHVELGLGFCPFSFFYGGVDYDLLAEYDGHFNPLLAYLPAMAEWIRTHEVKRPAGRRIAVIVNTRLEATTGRLIGNLPDALAEKGDDVGVFDSLRVIAEPSLLDGYAFAVTSSSYLDPRLLEALERFDGRTLLFGRLDVDAWARTGEAGLAGVLAKRGLFLDAPDALSAAGALGGSIDLAGAWDFHAAPAAAEAPGAPMAVERWDSVAVPGMWPEKNILGSNDYHLGDGWHRKTVNVPAGWRGRSLRFEAGAIDDLDWVFWNGKLIGHTGEKVSNYWAVPRGYDIPPELVRYGQPNELVVCVRNLRDNGGIWRGPVAIRARARGAIADGGREIAASVSQTATLLAADRMAAGAEMVLPFATPDTPGRFAALARQGGMYWYFKDTELDASDPADALALRTFFGADGR